MFLNEADVGVDYKLIQLSKDSIESVFRTYKPIMKIWILLETCLGQIKLNVNTCFRRISCKHLFW